MNKIVFRIGGLLVAAVIITGCSGAAHKGETRQDSAMKKELAQVADADAEGWLNNVPSPVLLHEAFLETYDEQKFKQLKEELQKRGYVEEGRNFLKEGVCEISFMNGSVGDTETGNVLIIIDDEDTLEWFFEELEALTLDDPDLEVSRTGDQIAIMRMYED